MFFPGFQGFQFFFQDFSGFFRVFQVFSGFFRGFQGYPGTKKRLGFAYSPNIFIYLYSDQIHNGA